MTTKKEHPTSADFRDIMRCYEKKLKERDSRIERAIIRLKKLDCDHCVSEAKLWPHDVISVERGVRKMLDKFFRFVVACLIITFAVILFIGMLT